MEAKFTNKELSELGELADCVPLVDSAQLPAEVQGEMSDRDRRLSEKNLATLRTFAERNSDEKRKRLHFVFFARPVEVLGNESVTGLRLERTRVESGRAVGTGETFEIDCGAVVAAIGYRMQPVDGAPLDPKTGMVANQDGRVAEGVYVVGWAKRGPVGVIGTNKTDGDVAAEQIVADIERGHKPGRPDFERLLTERGVRWVTFEDWERIEAGEVAAAPPGAPRRKFTRVDEMLAVLDKKAAAT